MTSRAIQPGVEPGSLPHEVVALGEVRRPPGRFGVETCRRSRVPVPLVKVRGYRSVARQGGVELREGRKAGVRSVGLADGHRTVSSNRLEVIKAQDKHLKEVVAGGATPTKKPSRR